MSSRPILVAYDISDNKTRSKVRRILQEWRLDGQLSVHECHLRQSQAEELFLQLGALIDQGADALLMAWINPHRAVLGRGRSRNHAINAQLRHIR